MSWSAETQETDTSVDADLKAVYQGGENFLARAQMLSNMRAQSEQALKDLNLGQAAVAAFKQAKADQAEAKKNRAEAQAILTAAQKRVEVILQDANDAAMRTMDRGRDEAAAIVNAANQTRAEAEREVTQWKQNAAAQVEAANAQMAAANAAKETAAREMDKAAAAKRDAEAAKQHHDELAAKLQAKLDAIARAASGA